MGKSDKEKGAPTSTGLCGWRLLPHSELPDWVRPVAVEGQFSLFEGFGGHTGREAALVTEYVFHQIGSGACAVVVANHAHQNVRKDPVRLSPPASLPSAVMMAAGIAAALLDELSYRKAGG